MCWAQPPQHPHTVWEVWLTAHLQLGSPPICICAWLCGACSTHGACLHLQTNGSLYTIPTPKNGQRTMTAIILMPYNHHHHHHYQKAFRNKSHTSHGQRPGLKRNNSKGKIFTINYSLINYWLTLGRTLQIDLPRDWANLALYRDVWRGWSAGAEFRALFYFIF